MKNRLLAYGFGSGEPQQTKAPSTPPKKARARRGKGKRLICRILQAYDEDDGSRWVNAKVCIYVDRDGNYYVSGKKVSPSEALRQYVVWDFSGSIDARIVREAVDREEMMRLLDAVVPHIYKHDDDDDSEGDEWKAAAE